jgi:hypothetical protein
MSNRDRLDSYLKQIEKRLRLEVLFRGAAILSLTALLATVVLVLITNAFAFSAGSVEGARVALFLALLSVLAAAVAMPVFVLNRRRAATRTETVCPEFQQRLLTFVDRDQDKREPFIELLAADTLALAEEAQPARLISRGKLLLFASSGSACLSVLIWMMAAGPGYLGYGARRLWAGSSPSAAFYDIRVSPGNAAVRRNASQTITAQPIGFESPRARLWTRYQSASKWEEAAMEPQPAASGFQFVFAGIPEDVEYYIEAGRVQSRHYKIRVVDLPSIKQIRVTYHYPAWTRFKSAVKQGGDLHAVKGTNAELVILTDRPMRGGVLAINNGQEAVLSGGKGNLYQGTIRIERNGTYHVAALSEGQLVRLSDDFLIEAGKANPPEVSIIRPRGDYQASPIEEVTVAVKAADDYGLNGVSLHYSINGGREQTVNMLKRKGAKETENSTILYLENFKVVPGDVVSLYAKAGDANAESRSDLFFVEVEPFDREYSQSQLGGGGGIGGQQDEISQREKEIIAATWNQRRDLQATRQESAETGKFLSGVQDKLRRQTLGLTGRLESRGLSDANDEFTAFQRDMNAAAQEMGPASAKLKQQQWQRAIPNEQKALDQLLRAEATFRRIEVAFGSQGGGGGGAGAGRDLENLLDLELDTQKNQYETAQTAESARQHAQEMDKALEKLDELARREQELAGQPPRNMNQSFQQRWQQEMLRREAARLQKQMDQLAQSAREGQQPGAAAGSQETSGASQQGIAGERIQRALDELRQARNDMRRAGSQQDSAAAARRAASRLQEAVRLLHGFQRGQSSGRLGALARQADRLAGQERDQAARIRQMFGNNNGASSPGETWSEARDREHSKLADDRELLATDLSRLEKAMQDAARELEPAQHNAAAKLNKALGQMDQADLQSRLMRSAEAIRLGIDPGARTIEPAIAKAVDRLGKGIRAAQQALKGQQPNPTEEALNRIDQLRNEIDALTRSAGNPSATNAQPGEQPQSSQEGQNNQQSESGKGGQGATGDRASQSGNANGGFQSGAPGGPRAWRGGPAAGFGAYIQPLGAGSSQRSDSDELALQGAIRELGGLRRLLRSKPDSAADVQQLMRDLQRLGPGRFQSNPALVEQLRAQALTSLDKLELGLRREMDNEQSGKIRSGDFLQVPPGYQGSVAEYFRRLSKAH